MNDERQEWISKRAYGLWETEGRPPGRDHEHWEKASREREELEKVALPENLKKKRNPDKIDEATQAAVDLTRRSPPEDDGQRPSSRKEGDVREAVKRKPFR